MILVIKWFKKLKLSKTIEGHLLEDQDEPILKIEAEENEFDQVFNSKLV